MLYVTEQQLRTEIREIHNLINTLAREVNSEIKNLQEENKSLKEAVELLHSEVLDLNNKLKLENTSN